MLSSMHELDAPGARVRFLQTGRRLAFPAPDAVMALLLAAAAAVEFLPPALLARVPHAFLESREELSMALVIEGAFLMAQATLVDIATRLRKRPPVWAIPLIAGAVVLFSDHARQAVVWTWQNGGTALLIPLLLSLAERATILWRMPVRTDIQKIAERALVGNRITTGIGVLVVFAAGSIASMYYDWSGGWVFFAAGALYFAIAAFDEWRVRGARFARNPRVLFGFDPIHIKYLEPV
jgi:hypothetical protein